MKRSPQPASGRFTYSLHSLPANPRAICLLAFAILAVPLFSSGDVSYAAPPQQSPDPASTSTGPSLVGSDGWPELAPFIFSQPGRVGIAVMDREGSVLQQLGGAQRFPLASVSKLYIMVAYLDLVSSEDRAITDEEKQLIEGMIEASDNEAASTLWRRLGGSVALQDFLSKRRLPLIIPAEEDDAWGSMRASAVGVGTLLAQLYDGRLLNEEHTQLAMEHLTDVIDSQRWGVGTLGTSTYPDQSKVYVKNGWYPRDDGWLVNTAGVIEEESRQYVIVILSEEQPSLELGKYFVSATVLMLRTSLWKEAP